MSDEAYEFKTMDYVDSDGKTTQLRIKALHKTWQQYKEPDMSTVFVKADQSVGMPNGAIYHLRTNEPWDADDPLVKLRPDCFSDESPDVRTSGGWVRRSARGVEQATANPGKKRNR